MPYREARSVAESSEGPTASKSDRTGRNPGMTRLVRRSSAMSGGAAFFSLVHTFRQRMRKCFVSLLHSLTKNLTWWFLPGIHISIDYTGLNVTLEPCACGLLETEVRDGFVQTGTPEMLCCKHGGSRVKFLISLLGKITGSLLTFLAPKVVIFGKLLSRSSFVSQLINVQ